jgi:hypothetical protein
LSPTEGNLYDGFRYRIHTEIAKQDTTDLLPVDVKSIRQAIYRRQRKMQLKVERRNAQGARSVRDVLQSR